MKHVTPSRTYLLGLVMGFFLHAAIPSAHAVESYSSQLARIASAAERIASTLEKASR